MRNLQCILIRFFTILLIYAEQTESRSISIEFSHKFKYAVDDVKEQEGVNLDRVAANIRKELEDSVRRYREERRVIHFEISENETSIEKRPKLNVTKSSKNVHLMDMMMTLTTPSTAQFIDTPLPPIEERVFRRRKRHAELAALANKNVHFTNTKGEMTAFEVISREDIVRARRERMKDMLTYIGITLAAVVGFALFAFCLIMDPRVVFIICCTSCPCALLLCPCCTLCLKKFLSPGAIVRENTNKYIPGVIVDKNGKMEIYEPSEEEISAVREIIDLITNMV